MKILTIHNRYQIRGGEDEVHDAELHLLRSRGHDVRTVTFDNAGIKAATAVSAGLSSFWSRSSYRRVSAEIASARPDIVSIHNFFPLATPAVHDAAAAAGIPVVQTLHNFRTLCPNGMLFRAGEPCEDCVGKLIPWPGIAHACYRENRMASAAVATMISVQNLRKTWHNKVTLFFALTEFARKKFIQGGLPAERLVVKPNFVPSDLGPGTGDGGFVFYAGRFSDGKGIPLLLDAWRKAKPRGKLLLAGEGPLAEIVKQSAATDDTIQFLGRLTLDQTYKYMGNARALVFPSLWYEGMPRVIIESFSRGTPVIASRFGSMAEMIRHGETGWLVDRGNTSALASALTGVFSDNLDHRSVRAAARAEFEGHYTADRQYDLLMNAYGQAIRMKFAELAAAGRHVGESERFPIIT